jgi:hypothetical protein
VYGGILTVYTIRESARIFITVTVLIFTVSVVRGVDLGQSITLGICCGFGGAFGGVIGLKFWRSRKMRRDTGHRWDK